ncbi:tyrosine-type recombinase/integrase [Bacillus toyonensis]
MRICNSASFCMKYPGIYVDDKGNFFYQSEFGIDRIKRKRIRKKGREDVNGKPFSSAFEANKELTRLKREYHKVNSYANYKTTYEQFMNNVYIPYYQTEVEESDFVFSYDGLPMIKSTIGRIIQRYSKLAGVKKIQAKGLRHSHASYLINEFNVSVLVLSQRMGHSSPEITLKHYAHMWSGADTAIADTMNGNIDIKTAESTKI